MLNLLDLDKVVSKLINLSEQKFTLLEDLMSLTEKQTGVIEVEDVDGLNLLIDRKQEKLDIIKQLDIQFEAVVSDLKTLYEIKSLDELEFQCSRITVLKEVISRIMDILREICEIEKKNKEKMLKAKDALQEKIYSASKGKRAIQQYGNFDSYTDAYFIDRKIK